MGAIVDTPGWRNNSHRGAVMNRGDFIADMPVRLKATGKIMVLGGTIDDWTCTDPSNAAAAPIPVQPEDVEPAVITSRPADVRKP